MSVAPSSAAEFRLDVVMKFDADGQGILRKGQKPLGWIRQSVHQSCLDFVMEAIRGSLVLGSRTPIFSVAHVADGPARQHPRQDALTDQEFVAVGVTDERRLEHEVDRGWSGRDIAVTLLTGTRTEEVIAIPEF